MQLEEEDNPKKVITTATPVQIGLVLLLAGFLGTDVWNRATVNAKVDVIIAKIGGVEDSNKSLRSDLNGLLIWKAEIDRSGSKQVDELKKQFDKFQTDFQIHMAQTVSKR